MRRFIHVVALASALAPATALAQSSGESTSASAQAPASGSTAAPSSGETAATGEGTSTTPRRTSTSSSSTAQTGTEGTSASTGSGTSASTGSGDTTVSPSGQPVDSSAHGAASTPSAAPPPLPWRGTSFIWDNSVTPETIAPSVQLSPNPSYQWWMSFRPRWQLPANLSIRGRIDLTTEWYQSSSTTHAQEPQFGDLWADLVWTGIPQFGGVRTVVGLRTIWPTSLRSQSAHMYMGLGATLGFTRDVNLGRGHSLNFSVSGAVTHNFTEYTSASVTDGGYSCVALDTSLAGRCFQTTGTMLPWMTAVANFGLTYTPIEHFDFSASYALIWTPLYNVPDATIVDRMAGSVPVARATDDPRFREFSWLVANFDYEPANWINFSLGYYVYRPILDPGGNIGNPLWSPGQNTRIFFTTTFELDAIYTALFHSGGSRAAAGGNARSLTYNNGHRGTGAITQMAREIRNQQMMNGTF